MPFTDYRRNSIKKSFGSRFMPRVSKSKSDGLDEFFFEERKEGDAIALTIQNEDNFENVVIKEEIKRELTSPHFWVLIIVAAIQNASLIYFYTNFKFIYLRNFDDDFECTKIVTCIEFLGRIAKIGSSYLFEIWAIETLFYGVYVTNIAKNIVFVLYGAKFWVFVQLLLIQKILEGFVYIYNYVYIFRKYENKGSFLMKVFETHKLLSLLLSTAIAAFLHLHFDFETAIAVLTVTDIVGLLLRQFE